MDDLHRIPGTDYAALADPTFSAEIGAWRAQKLLRSEQNRPISDPVEIRELAHPSAAEKDELIRRCTLGNAAFYACSGPSDDSELVRDQLLGFSDALGLRIAERHRSAGRNGIVALSVSNKASQSRYIPYSRRPMNWHTDGYYNAPENKIRAMVLHCVRPAADGGENQFLDPEIAFIRLWDENPAYVTALCHPMAMTIPENSDENGTVRPESVGPVFSTDPQTGQLEMRYTARTRSITWRTDDNTRNAVAFLNDLMSQGDTFMQTTKLAAGEGILCNNSLHNRTGFDPNDTAPSERLIFRIRFHNRVPRS